MQICKLCKTEYEKLFANKCNQHQHQTATITTHTMHRKFLGVGEGVRDSPYASILPAGPLAMGLVPTRSEIEKLTTVSRWTQS